MKPPWSRRQWSWYWLFIGAVVAGAVLLDFAIKADDRPIVLALVLVGIAFAVAIGLVVVVRSWRER